MPKGGSPSLIYAIRGPVTLITLGALFALDHFTPYSFKQTWPLLLIVFGLLSLAARSIISQPAAPLAEVQPALVPAKRRSVVGPLLIILIGALLLALNLRPQAPLFHLLSLHWPFVLIAWGTLRLIEVLIATARSWPLPAGLSGGEVVLVVFICFIGSGLYSINENGDWIRVALPPGLEIFGEHYEYPINVEKPAGKSSIVVFENLKGNVRVKGGDTDRILISGHKSIRAFHNAEADRFDQETPLEVTSQGDRIIIGVQERYFQTHPRFRTLTLDLDVTIPRGASIEERGHSGDLEVTDVAGGANISGDTAGVRLSKIGGDVRIETRTSDLIRAADVKGNVTLDGHGTDVELQNIQGQVSISGSYSGTLELQNLAKPLHFAERQTDLSVQALPGRINMDLGQFTAKNVMGPVRLSTKSRDIKIEEFTQTLDLETDTGDIELRPVRLPLSRIDAHSRAGNTEVWLPDSAKFVLKAHTASGEAVNEFGSSIRTETDGRSAWLKGEVDGGPPVTLTTERGTVAVRKASSEHSKDESEE